MHARLHVYTVTQTYLIKLPTDGLESWDYPCLWDVSSEHLISLDDAPHTYISEGWHTHKRRLTYMSEVTSAEAIQDNYSRQL